MESKKSALPKRTVGYLIRENLYSLCNRKQYFTCGTSRQYEIMFDLAVDGRPASDIALIIWVCSDTNKFTYNEIFEDVKNAMYAGEGDGE